MEKSIVSYPKLLRRHCATVAYVIDNNGASRCAVFSCGHLSGFATSLHDVIAVEVINTSAIFLAQCEVFIFAFKYGCDRDFMLVL